MQFSLTLIALVAFATTVSATPVRKIAKRGGPEICTLLLNGQGFADNQVTKDCCAAVDHKAFYNEVQKECTPNSGIYGNSVDTGAMVECCTSRGKGSRAINY